MSHDHIVNMSREQAVKEGYLVVIYQGTKTCFLPTDKYRFSMMNPELPPAIVHTRLLSYSVNDDDKETVCIEMPLNQ